MSRADGVLVVSLTYRWFDMIESGEKLEEYRGRNWAHKLFNLDSMEFAIHGGKINKKLVALFAASISEHDGFFPYHTFRAQRAYTGVWMERKIKRIRWGKPRPEWSGNTVTGECFVIELEAP